jgi:tRNA(Arg) A34 adenosine deaminase TadA
MSRAEQLALLSRLSYPMDTMSSVKGAAKNTKSKPKPASEARTAPQTAGQSEASREAHMRSAIRLALAGVKDGKGGPFGAVIVRRGRVIARGSNCVPSSLDPTAHAEVVAIRAACQKLKSFRLDDCELYTSCEPCPMCLAAIYWARIPNVYYAGTRADAAAVGFDDALIYDEIALPLERRTLPLKPLLRADAQAAFKAWDEKRDKVPY